MLNTWNTKWPLNPQGRKEHPEIRINFAPRAKSLLPWDSTYHTQGLQQASSTAQKVQERVSSEVMSSDGHNTPYYNTNKRQLKPAVHTLIRQQQFPQFITFYRHSIDNLEFFRHLWCLFVTKEQRTWPLLSIFANLTPMWQS